MKKATTAVFIDSYHPNKENKCAVSIRVTYDRKKKYYPTGISLTANEFKNVMQAKRRDENEKKLFTKLQAFEAKAIAIIERLTTFTFPLFEKQYIKNRGAVDSVSFAFEEYTTQLYSEDRVSSARTYESAKESLNDYKPGLRFADITPTLLRDYEKWMYKKENSPTTVGIYIRNLRRVFNLADVDKSIYPFKGKDCYRIPTSRNIKKALTLEEIGLIYNATLEAGSIRQMARDYWIFIYLSNGINVKDMCQLRYKNIDGEFIKFERSKSDSTKKVIEEIRISLKKDAKDIIKKWGQKSLSPETYIFPHLKKGLTAVEEWQIVQQLTHLINDHMKEVAKQVEINKPVTTYYARHSFATVLKRSGASTEFISEALGHSSLKTTKSYLAGFENETLQHVTEALTAFKK